MVLTFAGEVKESGNIQLQDVGAAGKKKRNNKEEMTDKIREANIKDGAKWNQNSLW